MASKGKQFKALMHAPEILVQPGVYDGYTVRLVEQAGFKFVTKKHNTMTLQRGFLMERISNIPGIGMLAIMLFQKSSARR